MKLRILTLFLVIMVLPLCLGCGGGGYKDRIGNTDFDPDAEPVGPGDVGDEE